MELQKVSIVIVNYNGKHHLRECFGSILKLHYPKDKVEVIVVDNGSSDGSVELIEKDYSWVKLLRNTKNEGFAKPSNDGARAATGEYVAFINNDMRVQHDWLIELINSMQRNNAKCAGSVILNWDGKLLDFGGGGVNFYGLGYQDDFQCPMSEMEKKLLQDKDIMFACGGSMIVDRELFLFAGGFDEDYFAYYEDVDLGWRLHVLGCKIVLSVKSRVFHKHNGTSKSITKERVQYLFERNKLYTCYKNYGEELFYKIFMPSIMLEIRETYLYSGIDGFNYNIKNPGAFDNDPVNIGHRAAMKLSALNEFVENIAAMSKKRSFIQENRKTSDDEVMKFMEKPFIVFPKDSSEFLSAEHDFVRAFGIDKLMGHPAKTRILLVAGQNASDNSWLRSQAIAELLAQDEKFDVTVATPHDREINKDSINAVPYAVENPGELLAAASQAAIVVLISCFADDIPQLKTIVTKKYVVTDVSNLCSFSCENVNDDQNSTDKNHNLKKMSASLKKLISIADYLICSDEKQKDYLTGMLAAFDAAAAATVAVMSNPFKAGEQKALVDYCSAPSHNMARMDANELDIFDDSVPVCTGESNPDDGDGDPLREQLARIEKQQTVITQMLMSDKRLLKETHTGVRELKDWSLLMESRFFKLKQKLMRFKFLRRFVG